MRWSISKELTCPTCGVVIADATYRRWPGNLVLVSPEGVQLQPESVAVQLRRVQEGRSGDSPGGTDELDARVDYLRRHLEELVYDLRCRNGHSALRTMPRLVRAIRDARGQWVDPA
jgi:hypothetical protein